MTKRKTDKEFKQQVFDLVGDEYTFLDAYKNNRTKMWVKHNKCGNTYQVVPDSFLRGRRCPFCQRKVRVQKRTITNEEFLKRVYKLVGDEYTFLEPYVNSRTAILVRHNKCGKISKMEPNNFLSGARCKYCAHNVKLTTQQVKERIKKMYGNEYTLLSEYKGMNHRIKVMHNKCGYVYTVGAINFLLSKQRCPKCYKTPKKTANEFQRELNNIYGKSVYTIVGKYINAKTRVEIKCSVCGNVWLTKPNWILSGQSGCPYCNQSHGERLIASLLNQLEIAYVYPYKIKDLKDKQELHYDFYIPDQKILIEYQGLQHYESIDYFGGKDQFKIQQKHDQMKREYAKEHGYKLIEVPYTEDTLGKIKKYLINHGLKLN